jgi:prophage regulatory protein
MLPETGFLRIDDVLKFIPVGKSSWWAGVASGRYPSSVKLGPRTTAWRVEDFQEDFERLTQSFEAIAADVVEIKVSQARTDERFSASDTQLEDIKLQLRSQDTRLWGFIVALSLAVIGFLSKLAFLPAT